jgi:hypothetical protein
MRRGEGNVGGMPSRIPRPSGGRRPVAELVAVWGLTVATTLLFAHVTAVGPTLLRLTRTHGVHLGDIVFTLAAAAVAVLITRRLIRRGR